MTYPEATTSLGSCRLCGESHPREEFAGHLQLCLDRTATASKAKPVDAFHIEVEGFNRATASVYWLHVLARADATLFDLDKLLRNTWLEPCCGHMSAFELGPTRFEAYPDDEFGPPARSMRDATLSEVLATGRMFEHEYDVGSTTEVALHVVERRAAVVKGRAKIQLVAQNEAPALDCGSCGKPAVRVCAAGCEADDAVVCRSCAPKHECSEDMLSPIMNSPRTGVCGYPTEPLRGQRGTWVMTE